MIKKVIFHVLRGIRPVPSCPRGKHFSSTKPISSTSDQIPESEEEVVYHSAPLSWCRRPDLNPSDTGSTVPVKKAHKLKNKLTDSRKKAGHPPPPISRFRKDDKLPFGIDLPSF